jgi:hypothetical protein
MNYLIFDAIEYKKQLIAKRDEIESNGGYLGTFDLN